ncbi:MAG: HAMP domain-containing sensor histidine kinase, partial [Bacteroidota bacterium]
FMVYGQEDQQARFKAANVLASQLLESPQHVQLFPTLRRQGRYELFVSLEEGNFYALRGLWLQVLGTILFSGIILACFWLSIRVILRQKRVSEMKNDFINNMTHELKTPIATISLATDALRNPQMRGSDEALNRYLGIIKDENARMHRQVERVLQAAQFGRKAIGLNPSDINLHTLIREVVEPVALKVKQRNGQLNLDLRANAPLLHVDRQHIANVLNNLLDNANKYSPDAPHITLKTWSEEGAICVSVQDQGLGISKADQAEIFTRFFRVSTGNLHDVKGFGLGLSYVKEIVEAHGGDIRVQSVLGAGSTFTVQLPTSTPSEQN